MGGFDDVTGWDSLDAVAEKVRAIPGLTAAERADISDAMHRAIENEHDVAKKAALVQKVMGLATSAATGGIGGLFKAALGGLGI